MSKRVTLWLAYAVLVFMIVLVIAAVINMRQKGSLDDLPADVIKKAVGDGG